MLTNVLAVVVLAASAITSPVTWTGDPFIHIAGRPLQCGEYVESQVHETHGYWLGVQGNALSWAAVAQENGYTVSDQPAVGAILVMQPYHRGMAGQYGHVAFVQRIEPERVYVIDCNWNGDGAIHQHWIDRDPTDG
jgi:surface antigen